MKNAKVTVIVPVYNVEQYLEQCIQSILSQTYDNLEIILINDGSTDSSAKICQYYADIDTRITYLEQSNQGVSVARNLGLHTASGEWVSFVDADDWITPDMISVLLNESHNSDVIIGDFYVSRNDKSIKTSFFASWVDRDKKLDPIYLIGNSLCCTSYGTAKYCSVGTPWAKLYRRDFLLAHNLEFSPGVRRMQDVVFNVRVFMSNPRVAYCDCNIYYYRISDNSASHRYDPNYDDVVKQVMQSLEGIIGNGFGELQKLYDFKRLWLMLECISRFYCHPQCTLAISGKRAGIRELCLDDENSKALKIYDRTMFTNRQRVVLGCLSHHLYSVTLLLYYIKNHWITRNES